MSVNLSPLPTRIHRLTEFAQNLWWSWHSDAIALFARVEPLLWEQSQHNPITLLQSVAAKRWSELAQDPSFLRHYDAVVLQFDTAVSHGKSLSTQDTAEPAQAPIAYFSAEFGLHHTLPIYSGGLGVLAGDHCKEASDLGIALIGIGLFYRQGYFLQRLSADGKQAVVYTDLDETTLPATPVLTPEGNRCVISILGDQRRIYAQAWQVCVGRVDLYLLDTNIEENEPDDRYLSARLYGGDQETRILQEILLGIGGVRLLRTVGIEPQVWHLNEGHAAFATLERIRQLATAGIPFSEAITTVRRTTVFTTHTLVPAGHDVFAFDLLDKYLVSDWKMAGLSRAQLFDLGRHKEAWGDAFHMTVLALRMADHRNGVSQTHGDVSRHMWQKLWPEKSTQQAPITAVTNGVHLPTWIAPELDRVYRKYLGPDWVEQSDDPTLWQHAHDIPHAELWAVRTQLRHRLTHFLRNRARHIWMQEDRDPEQLVATGALLDPDTLTIGFARRFATYKRATLILRDLERLRPLVCDRRRPMQIIFAGKAHPADASGQELIRQVYAAALDSRFGGRIVFVENYDMSVAKFLIQGVDVWLNNPIPPFEASGTSGQKAALNGVPNLSISDGWWTEGYSGKNGWLIHSAEQNSSEAEHDESAGNSLYTILENEVLPLFYQRDSDGIPRGWMQVVKESISSLAPQFSARRMLKEYVERLYLPAARKA